MAETPLYTAPDIATDYDYSIHEWIAVLPDGRRIVLAHVRAESDCEGWCPTCDPRHEDGSSLSDDEVDDFDSWLSDVCAEILEH